MVIGRLHLSHFLKLTLAFVLVLTGLELSANTATGSWTSFDFEGSKVHFYRPQKSKRANSQKALMINLHGCAQKGSVLKDHGNWETAADENQVYIAIPEVPDGGVYAGCWDYYGLGHKRDRGHNQFILKLIDHIKGLYAVNPHQIYLSGLSSGGGLAMVQACLAPEVIAGVGLNAAPSVGSMASDITSTKLSVSEIKRNCLSLAQNKSSHLQTQVAAVIFGDNDFIVDTDYNRRNAQALAELYGSDKEESFDLSTLPGTRLEGRGTLYKKADQKLVSLIENNGLGHNWPAGSGIGFGPFVNSKSVNFPSYLLNFLISNNRRP